ncbi:Uncharacterised protein [Citrobacter freundii]|nr:Uncharacterised protein [Citrobacter freundii]
MNLRLKALISLWHPPQLPQSEAVTGITQQGYGNRLKHWPGTR